MRPSSLLTPLSWRILLAAGLCPLAGQALAQTAPYTPPPVPSGLSAEARISETGSYDTNPLMLVRNSKSLYGSTTSPELILKDSCTTWQLSSDSTVNENVFDDSTFNSTDFHEKANLTKTMEIWSAGLIGNFDYDTTRTSEITTYGLNLPRVRHTGVTVGPTFTFRQTSVDSYSLNTSATESRYDSPAFTDYNFYSVAPSYSHNFDPRNAAVFTVNMQRYETESGIGSTADSYGPSVGWTSILNPRTTAKINAGMERSSESSDTGVTTNNGKWNYVFSGDLSYSGLQDISHVTASRSQSPFANGAVELLDAFTFTEDHKLNDVLLLNLAANYQFAQYPSEPGVNLSSEYGTNFGLTYQAFRNIDLTASYQFRNEKLTDTSGTIREQAVYLGLTFHPGVEILMEELSLPDIIAILKRRKGLFLVTFVLIGVFAMGFALTWSNFRSTATVEIEPSFVSGNVTAAPGENANDTIAALADQRISQIEQKVTSLESLAEIISKFNLYPKERENTPVSYLTDRMRKKIKLDFVSGTVANPAAAQKETAEQLSAIAFMVSFDYNDPRLTQQVTDELVTRFLDEDLKLRRTQAQMTSSFLDTQIKTLENSMAEQEKQMADFRAKNGESGPSVLMFNQQAAANASIAMQNIESQITSNEGTQGALKAQLAVVDPYSRVVADGQVLTTPAIQLKALESQYAAITGQYGPDHPDVVKLRREIAALKAQMAAKEPGKATGEDTGALQAQITDLKTNLAAATTTKGADHPDVVAMKGQLAALEARLAKAKTSDNSTDDLKADADNPAYLQLTAQLKSAIEQHKALLAQRDTLQAQQEKYEKTIAENPAIEQEMSKLSRDYENAQLRYRELKEKKMAADMTEQLEEDSKGQRLIVTNPPAIPETTQPKRILLVLGALFGSIVAGLGSVGIAEAMSQSVHGPHHLASIVGAQPLVIVPHIYTEDEVKRSFWFTHYALAGLSFLRIFALGAFISIVMGIDALWHKISRRAKAKE